MKIIFCIIIITTVFVAPCYANVKAKSEVKKGNVLYNKGEFENALKQYEEAFTESPNSDIVNFNLGTALYKLGEFGKAIEHFERSLVADDESLGQKASYNLGNTQYKFGMSQEEANLSGAVEALKKSLHHYEQALALNEGDEDAKYNYEFVQKELERLEEKLQKQKQQQKQCPLPEDQEQQDQQEQSQQEQTDEEKGKQQSQQKQGVEEEKQQTQQPEEDKDESKEQVQQSRDQQQQAMSQVDQAQKMSEKEAEMLLESYQHEEEPQGLYKGKIPTRRLPDVVKDW